MLSDKVVRDALQVAADRIFGSDSSRPDGYAREVAAQTHPVVLTAQANLEGGGTDTALKDATTSRVNQLGDWLMKQSEETTTC